jgi:hypothetical protein
LDPYVSLNVIQLRAALRFCRLKVSGIKADLKASLEADDKTKSSSLKTEEVPGKKNPLSHPTLPKTPSKRCLDDDREKQNWKLLRKTEAPDKLLARV